MMQECMPPCPGMGMNITISIDLGDFMSCPPPCPPSTSLTKMPPCPQDPCEPEKLTYFNEESGGKESEDRGFGSVKDRIASKHSGGSSFSDDGSKDDKEKDDKDKKDEDEEDKKEAKE